MPSARNGSITSAPRPVDCPPPLGARAVAAPMPECRGTTHVVGTHSRPLYVAVKNFGNTTFHLCQMSRKSLLQLYIAACCCLYWTPFIYLVYWCCMLISFRYNDLSDSDGEERTCFAVIRVRRLQLSKMAVTENLVVLQCQRSTNPLSSAASPVSRGV